MLACTFLTAAALAPGAASAQTTDNPAPVHVQYDENGVDVSGDSFNTFIADVAAGPAGRGGLAYVRPFGYPTGTGGSSYDLGIFQNVTVWTATIGFQAFAFMSSNGTSFISTDGSGATLTKSGSTYTLTSGDGTIVAYAYTTLDSGDFNRRARGTSITYPSGENVTLSWADQIWCTNTLDGCPGTNPWRTAVRLQAVSSSLGYQLHFNYGRANIVLNSQAAAWRDLDSISAINTSVDYCDPTAHSCSLTQSPPTVSYSGNSVTDPAGRTTVYTSSTSGWTIQRPTASSPNFTVSQDVNAHVTSVVRNGATFTYSYSLSGTIATLTRTDALSHTRVYTSELTVGLPTSIQDEDGHTTSYQYDTSGRLKRMTAPEGNYVEYGYDARGNVTTTTYTPKPGSTLSPTATSASFLSSCANVVTCNLPTSTTDARGNTTDYAYDATHGGVVTVTAPAPTTGATRPQTRYTWSALQAYVKDSGGSIVATGQNTYRVTGVSQCQTGSAPSCVGTSDEVKATIVYGSPGVANNLLPTSVTTGTGDNSVSATVTSTYDVVGNVATVDGPLPGTADMTKYRWNADRQLVGAVSPDPDGSGALKMRAVRNTFNPDGNVTKVEQGNVDSQSDADWAAFASLQEVDTGYDAAARPVTQAVVAAGTTYALGQVSYDALGRRICTATRMSPASFASLPSDACTLGSEQTAPDFGPDRITVTTYDPAGRVTAVTSAYGTPVQSDDVRYSYTNNGRVQTVLDAENNKTSYVYDGFDRVAQAFLPNPTKGSGASSTVDYEQYSYDENGNVRTRWQRDGLPIGFTWDALNRVTFKDLPGSDPDTSFAYDLFGRLTGATQGTDSVSFTYDAFGRKLGETGLLGTIQSQWDAAGRRVRMTWPDGTYVDYDHLVTGETSAVRQNGATSGLNVLATYGYDDLGRRTSLVRGNGTTTGYAYAGPQLTRIAHDLAGPGYDVAIDLSYNPAGQIATRQLSNDVYAYTAMGSGTKAYAINGLNQTSAAGSAPISFDLRGNMQTDGANNYTFSSDNRLTSLGAAPWAPVALGYDPLGRWTRGATYLWFGWDGDEMVIEKIGSASTRWVHGAGGEPLVREDPDGTWHWMHADERGSVIAGSLNDGSLENQTVRYDEYGRPQGGGYRYAYAGQITIGSGLAFFRNRVYNRDVGRFLQTDPIGYGGGMNMYAYVHADPVNFIDPSGLDEICFRGKIGAIDEDYGTTVIMGNICFPIGTVGLVGGGSGGGGGGRGGGNSPATPPPPSPPSPPAPCLPPLSEPGTISFKGWSGTLAGLVGASGTKGTFVNTRTGTHGDFVTISFIEGGDVSIGYVTGTFTNLAGFNGGNDNYFSGAGESTQPIGLGVTKTTSRDLDGNKVGTSLTVSIGTPAVGISFSNTELHNVRQTNRCARQR
jgi:RHS repeat-associated protein